MNIPRGIRQRGSGFFVDVSYKGQRKTATCPTLAEAIETQGQFKAALMNGLEVDTPRRSNAKTWTLEQALDKALAVPPKIGWRGMSYEQQATLNAQDAIKFFGPDRKLDAITLEQIDAWCHDCELRGNSDSTINRKLSALSKLCKVAINYGGLEAMPKLPQQRKEPVGRIRQISKAEEAELLRLTGLIYGADMANVIAVLIDTGMRCGELWNVRPDDVDLKNRVIMVYGTEGKGTKNGNIRSVPMTERVRDIFATQTPQQGLYFNYSNSQLRRVWDRARGQMGLAGDKDFSPHVCRHTCASRLVRAGVSIPIVQAWLGHSNIATTMRYAHLYPSDLMGALKQLEGAKE